MGAEGATGGMRPSGLGCGVMMMVMVVMMPGRGERRRREKHHQAEHKKLLHAIHHDTIGLDGNWNCDEESEERRRRVEAIND
jgi:hypothetical protein